MTDEPCIRTNPEIENRFRFHPPSTERRRRTHSSVRGACLALAEQLDALLPEGREKALALTNLEQAMFWANAAVARQTEPEPATTDE
jgi:hypothetical protein